MARGGGRASAWGARASHARAGPHSRGLLSGQRPALGRCEQSPWLVGLFARLLEGEPAVLGLLEGNPFPEAPPGLVRARLWRYRFTRPGERGWWAREERGDFCPVFRLRNGRLEVVPG